MKKSVLKQIYDCLKRTGEEVYFPSQHEGDCTKRYIVIKREGATALLNVSSERPIYSIMLYVPKNNYSQLEDMKMLVEEQLKELYPMVEYNTDSPTFYDENVKGHMLTMTYVGIRKINRFKKRG